jgi:drug/metabolite transporter (DMT)-like permease
MTISKKLFLISISIFSYFLFVLMDSVAKYLSDYITTSQIVWGRYFFHMVLMMIIYLFVSKKINLTKNFSIQIIRSLCLVSCTFLTYLAVKYNDLINFYIIFFTTPLFVSIFSYFFLKEKLSRFSIILIILSFITIIYALQPNESFLTIYIFLPLLTSIFFALYQLFTKIVSKDKEPFIALFYTGILGSIIFSVIVLFSWQPIQHSSTWIVLFFLGFIGYLSHFIFAFVLQSLDLSFITNFQYSQLIWASLINVYFFNDPLSTSKIIGIILIIFFGILFIQNRFKT